jgi:putative transposase
MALRDAVLGPLIMTLWVANYRVYGVRKMWKALHRGGEVVGRDQVARLMRQLGIQGVRRGKTVRTTRADGKADRHPDLVDRKFVAERPNALWVTDLERHEALLHRAAMKGRRLRALAGVR